ncbi:hypothetical protein HOD30_00590 [Candidatus Peregrinibacteria bacterium]|jgi:large repetitive protein|nr:hypothetical protein [Candidatus Peregrinibacteria bacterium]MBT4631961.1 hypothetical protein [Candidatus Peregrinibacteria bacterium]MBT5516969.1 hypothetical protein [Candidatus Peregrinibacteria bacterium]MBT5823650.1 hypothetical protein [Candidatus Peregrinibacteria bacterium]
MKKTLALLIISIFAFTACGERDTTYDELAACIADSEASFYGAFWCHNCENQLDMFGDSKDLLPYIECAEGGKDAEVQLCLNEEISSYPTWEFADGSRITGTQTMETLADETNCSLPGEEKSVLFQSAEETEPELEGIKDDELTE